MTTEELKTLKEIHPDAIRVWYDNMLEKDKSQLVEAIVDRMEEYELREILEKMEVKDGQ